MVSEQHSSGSGHNSGEQTFVAVSVAVLVISWSALALADAGFFSLGALAALVAPIGVGLVWLARRDRERFVERRPGHARVEHFALVTILVGAAALTSRPHEFLLGGADPGVYVSTGVNLARTGRLWIEDTELARLGEQTRLVLLRRTLPGQAEGDTWIRLPGFYVDGDPARGRVVPQFLPLESLWIAILHQLGGLGAALMATPAFGVLGVASVFFATRAMLGAVPVALIAAGLLAVSPLQVWFARYPTAEVATQFLVFGGAFAFIRFLDTARPALGVLAGVLWGTISISRFEPPIIPAVVAVFLVLRGTLSGDTAASSRLRPAPFIVAWIATTGLAFLHGFAFCRPYTIATLRAQLEWVETHASMAASALLVGVLCTAALVRFGLVGLRKHLSAPATERRIRLAALVTIALWAAYNYFVRPRLGGSELKFYWFSLEMLPTYDHENLVRLGWYLTPLGIALGVLGAMHLAWREVGARNLWFFAVLAGYTGVFIFDVANNPHQVYTMRRYVPVVLPAFCIASAAAIEALRRSSSNPVRRLAALALALVLAGWWLKSDRLWARHVDLKGSARQLAELAGRLDERDLVVFDEVRPGEELATPLQYVFGRTSFSRQRGVRADLVRGALDELVATGRRVVWAQVASTPVRTPVEYSLVPLGEQPIDLPVLEHSYTSRPEAVVRFQPRVQLYQVVKGLPPDRADIGDLDLAVLLGGFFGSERENAQRTFRWTGGVAVMVLPWPGGASARRARVQLRMHSGRPPGIPPPRVELSVATRPVGGVTVEAAWRDYSFNLDRATGDAEAQPYLLLFLRSDTFRPSALGLGDDQRDLGVMVDAVEITPLQEAPAAPLD